MSARVVYHALGGGHGHVMRGLAVLSRLGGGTLVGPAHLRPWAAALGVAYASPPDGCEIAWVSTQPVPDLLIADVFPRGVVGELARWLGRVPTWLVTGTSRPGSTWASPCARRSGRASSACCGARSRRPHSPRSP